MLTHQTRRKLKFMQSSRTLSYHSLVVNEQGFAVLPHAPVDAAKAGCVAPYTALVKY
jgi:hypothetical protein